ncbi:hypothetical protein H8959_000076, partial [Pygathrix nigripes]
SLQQRVAELEKINAEFLRAQQQLEQEFNQKRAKFKELYLAKEEDLKRQNAVLQAAQDDLGHLRTQLWEAQAEMENIKAIATVSENTKQEAIDEVKRQWREEVDSLQAVMKETVRDYEHQFHLRLEQERAQWAQYRESAEREIADLRRRLSEGQEEENLENEMKKAQEDAEKLRSVVMPMEKEIAALKDKLTEAEDKIKELEASKEHLDSTHGSVHSLDADLLLPAGDPFSKSDNDMFKDGLRRAQSTDSLGTSGSLQSKALGYNYKAKSAGNLDESDFGPLVGADSVSENFDTASLGSLQMPSGFMLTKDQERAIKAMTPEQEETASLLSSVTQGMESAYVSPSGYRLVSETEWNLLQKEVHNAGNKLGRRCDMCSNYEKQLQGIQTQEAETRDQVKKLQLMLRQANDQLEKTMKDKQELEDFIKQSSEDSSHQISALVLRAQASEILLEELQQGFSQAKRDVQEQMAVLMQSREQVSEELVRLQKDNDSLQGKHSLHVSLQQAEDFILPDTTEALRELVLKYREDIINVRTAADHVEEKLKAEILFLKEQIQAEQSSISSLKAELERIKVEKGQLESTLREKSQQLESLQEIQISLEEQLKKETAAKATVEQLMFEEKNKAQRLQTELDVSEQVQRDFVKLSQTLQVRHLGNHIQSTKAVLGDRTLPIPDLTTGSS